ncbi:hypothetical protein ACP4OV_007494 [Aristida adscensionis]
MWRAFCHASQEGEDPEDNPRCRWRAMFKKRCTGLLKKAGELATLCGVDVCVAVRGESEQRPALWPSPEEAARVVNRFNELPDEERRRKTMDLRAFVKL